MRTILRSIDQLADQLGLRQSARRRVEDADSYWADTGGAAWRDDSHWRGAGTFASDDDWLSIGTDHVRLTQRLAPGVLDAGPRVVEWGAGGGANAVHFGPLATELVVTDVSQQSLDECVRQVGAVCDTPARAVLVDLVRPEDSIPTIGCSSCDLFICFYVLELVPSEEYALRIVRIAHQVLRPGGVAVVQVKYRTAERRTRSHVRRYRRNVANMTTFAIDEFWLAAQGCGFEPEAVVLVPKNALDERYAYFTLRKPT